MAATVPGTTQIEGQDRAAVTHLLISTIHLVVGGALMLLALVARVFPDVFPTVVAYGRSRPMAMSSIIVGWLIVGFVGAAYQVLPRLTGTRLANENLATLGGWALGGLGVGGIAVVAAGLGDGAGLLGLPWWYDLAIAVVLLIPAIVTIQTIARRTETGIFPTLWFIGAAVVSLPILAFVSAIPTDAGLGEVLRDVAVEAGISTLWVTMSAAGIGWFVAVRATGNPLGNRQLARSGFLSLLFAGIWAGPAQVAMAPAPSWLAPMAGALTLALAVAAVVNALGIAQTVDDGWQDISGRPQIHALGVMAGFMVIVGLLTSVASFDSASALVGLTAFWDGVAYMTWFGIGAMGLAAWAWQTTPAMTGRGLADTEFAGRVVRWTMWFVGGTGLLFALSGVAAGLGTTGGAFAALDTEAWSDMTSTASVLSGLGVLTALGAFVAQLGLALTIYRTLTSGEATTQEVLVERSA